MAAYHGSKWLSTCPFLRDMRSGNITSVSLFSNQLQSNASAAAAMAIELLPEFGINVSSIRSVCTLQIKFQASAWSLSIYLCVSLYKSISYYLCVSGYMSLSMYCFTSSITGYCEQHVCHPRDNRQCHAVPN